MKYIVTFLLVLSMHLCFSQTDHNSNLVFNSITISSEHIKNFQLISSYYTLKNNIEKKWSSVYISSKPTLDEVENAATSLISEHFEIVKNHTIVGIIVFVCKPMRFMTVDIVTGKKDMLPCRFNGDITENRALEIVKEKYDTNAKIENNRLYFNGKTFSIVTNKEIKQALLNLIETKLLDREDSSGLIYRSPNDIKAIVLSESKQGGKMDFFTPIAGHEYDGIQVKPGVFGTKLGIALYQWGAACFDLGVNTVEDALAIFAEYKNQKATLREETYIRMGFSKDLNN